jgi:hypothetical protein
MIGRGAAPGVAYVYAPDRKATQPITHLSGFSGVLQVDGYAGYQVLAKRNDVQLAFCWSHVRRRFYELAAAGPAPIATEALERIAKLYVEKDNLQVGYDRDGALIDPGVSGTAWEPSPVSAADHQTFQCWRGENSGLMPISWLLGRVRW